MSASVRSRSFYLVVAGLLLSSLLLAWIGLGLLQHAGVFGEEAWPPREGVLAAVKERGVLNCGINGNLPYFSERTADGAVVGFDADFCRVVAVAIWGTAVERINFVELTPAERFGAVQTGQVDVLFRNTTWTVGRDTGLGVAFGPTTFYDGQKFMVRLDSGMAEIEDLAGARICVLPNTTTLTNLLNYFEDRGIEITAVTDVNGRPFADNRQLVSAYLLGECEAVTSDASQLIARRSEMRAGLAEHRIIPERPISKEPLGPVFIDGDPQWRRVVSYAVWATIYAEELGISSQNVAQYDAAADFQIKQFLGIDDPRIPLHIGTSLELPPDFAQRIISEVGNYGEIYTRHLGELIPERGENTIWSAENSGLLFAPPFRTLPLDQANPHQ